MDKRLIYVGGAIGSGKTMFCLLLGTDAEVGFIDDPPDPLPYPWATSAVKEGQRVWPGEWTMDGKGRVHEFSSRAEYRGLLGIPAAATVCRVSGDGFSRAVKGMSSQERERLLRSVQDYMLSRYDYVVHDMPPQFPLQQHEREILLAVQASDIAARAATPAWGGRGPFSEEPFAEYARRALWKKTETLWWTNGQWIPARKWIKEQVANAGPWYHYFELGGEPVGSKVALNGEDKWAALRRLLPEKLDDLWVLDIGSNAGYNAFRAAAEGARVLAIEPSSRYRGQMDLVRIGGPYPRAVTERVLVAADCAQRMNLSKEHFDIVLMSAVHYHINRASVPPYRQPLTDMSDPSWRPLNPSLAVLLEDLRASTTLLVVVTNTDHYLRKSNPFAEANPRWIANVLGSMGFTKTEIHPGFGKSEIVTARGRGDWVRLGEGIPLLQPGPEKLTLMLGWRCNSACIQCWQTVARKAKNLPRHDLPIEIVKDLLSMYRLALRDLELCSFGEPTLHPEFGELLKILLEMQERFNSQWRTVNIITNGSRLDKFQKIGDLPGMLTVSIDAPSAMLYESIRVGLHFKQVWHNVETIAKRKNHPQRKLGVNMTVFERNALSIVDMARLAAETGLGYLAILRGENMVMTPVADEELQAGDPRVQEQLQRVRDGFPHLELYDNFTTGAAQQTSTGTKADYCFCRLPWSSLDVGNDGMAHPCCRSYYTLLGKPTQGSDPWRHPVLDRLRMQLATDTLDEDEFKDCAKCPMRRTPWSS